MQKLISFLTISMFFASVLFQSCKGLPGTNGAQGNTGATGAQGPQGVAGTTGSNGKDGNANVLGRVLTVQASEWKKYTYQDNTYDYKTVVPIPEITQAVLDRGLVMVYKGNSSGASWTAMPFNTAFQSGNTTYVYDFDFVHAFGAITLWESISSGDTPAPTAARYYKVVVLTPQGRIANPNVNYKDYAEVAKAFNLE